MLPRETSELQAGCFEVGLGRHVVFTPDQVCIYSFTVNHALVRESFLVESVVKIFMSC